jgi:WD40 repeat protein
MARTVIVSILLLVSGGAARAQPMLYTVETVDWMAADSQVVVRAVVVDFAQEVDADKNKWNTVVLKVRETLKGKHQPFHTFIIPDWNHNEIARWQKSQQESLVFLADTRLPDKTEWTGHAPAVHFMWNAKAKVHPLTLRNDRGVIELKDPVSHPKNSYFAKVYTVEMPEAKEPQKLLQAVREAIAAADKVKVLRAHRVERPQWFTRIVPVNANLERHARRWVQSDDEKLREQGAIALKYFKSDDNVAALYKLLSDPAIWVDVTWKDGLAIERHDLYYVRAAAFASLKELGVEARKPVLKVKVSVGPQTAGELLKEVKKIHEELAGTWYFSDGDGPDAFSMPGYREMPKQFKDVKLVFTGDKVTIHHGKHKDEEPIDIPIVVQTKSAGIILGPPRFKFLGRRGIVRSENDRLELSVALVPEGTKPDFEFFHPDGSLRTFTATPSDFCGMYSFNLTFRRDSKPGLPDVTFGGPPAPNFGWGTLAWSSDGKQLAIAAGHSIEIRDPATGKLRHFLGLDKGVSSISYSPNGKWQACADDGGNIKLWDVDQRKVARAFLGGHKYAHCLGFSADGALLACQSGSEGAYRLMVWETATAKPVLKREPIWPGNGLAFTPDGRSIVSVEGQKSSDIHLLDVDKGKSTRTLKGEGDFTAFSFSSDGRYLVGAGQGRIVIWESATGRVIATQRYASPNAGIFEPRGHRVLVGGGYDLLLLDAATGKKLWQDHAGGLINAIAFAPDGSQFAVSTWFRNSPLRGWAPRLHIHETATGKKLREVPR